jgi:hypothetical protein
MLFFRKKGNKVILAELLPALGNMHKRAGDSQRKYRHSLDDVYGWSDGDSGKANGNSRVGLPAVKIKNKTK